MNDFEESRAALEGVVRRVFPKAEAGPIWRGIEGWRARRPKSAALHAQTGTYDPAHTVIGYATPKTGITVYFLDPGDYYILDKHQQDLAADGLKTGRGCIYWTRKGTLPTAALERMFRAVKARDAKPNAKAMHAPPTKAAAKRMARQATKPPRAKASASGPRP